MALVTSRAITIRPLHVIAFCGFNSALVYLFFYLLPYQLYPNYAVPRMPIWDFPENSPQILLVGWAILFQLYYIAYRFCPVQPSRRALTLLFCFPVFFSLLLYVMYPLGSNDVFDYIFRGHMWANLGTIPYGHVPIEFPDDPLLPYAHWHTAPGTYGPFWHLLIAGISKLAGADLLLNVLGYKLLALVHYWVAVVAMYVAVKTFRPEFAARGLVLFAWNPLLLYEGVASAHNDMLLLAWLVIAVLMVMKGHHILALLAFTLAALVKFISAMLLPLFLVVLWHAHAGKPLTERIKHMALAFVAMGAITLAVYAPYGVEGTLVSLRNLTDMTTHFQSSTPWLVNYTLRDVLGLTWVEPQNLRSAFGAFTLLLLLWHTVQLLRLRPDAQRVKAELVRRAFMVMFVYLLVASPWYWPWYLLWFFAFMPFLQHSGYVERAVVFTATSFLNYFAFFYGWPVQGGTLGRIQEGVWWLSLFPTIYFSLGLWFYQQGASLAARFRPAPMAGPVPRAGRAPVGDTKDSRSPVG